MHTVVRVVALLIVVAFWGLYVTTNWQVLSHYPWQLDYLRLLLAVALWCAYFTFMAGIWVYAARWAGATISMGAGMWIWVSSMLARYVPGSIWHVAGRIYTASRIGVSAEVTFVSTLVEQVLTVAGELIVFTITLPIWPNLPPSSTLLALTVVPMALLGLHPRVLNIVLRLISRALKRPPAAIPLGYRNLLLLQLGYCGAALVNGLAFFVLAGTLDQDLGRQLPLLVGGYLLARAIGFLSLITPTGIGVREAVLVAALSPYSPSVAMASALLARFLSTAAEGLNVVLLKVAISVRRLPIVDNEDFAQ